MQSVFGTRRSPAVGFLIAPLMPLLGLIALAVVTSGHIPEVIWAAMIVLPMSYLTSLIVGGPLVYLLGVWQKNRIWHYILLGVLASFIPIFVTMVYPLVFMDAPVLPNTGWLPAHTNIALVMGISGALTSVSFWLITRPDQLIEPSITVTGLKTP